MKHPKLMIDGHNLATLPNARAWAAKTDQFCFCLDLLDMSLVADGENTCNYWVNRLENEFDLLIENM